jgi:hypothetical protein
MAANCGRVGVTREHYVAALPPSVATGKRRSRPEPYFRAPQVSGGRRRRLKIPATWPWADDIATAWARITALPHAP